VADLPGNHLPDEPMTPNEFHTRLAKGLFNHTWTLLDLEDRTPAQDEEMLLNAYGSRYHWSVVGEPIHFVRGEWQLSRVYSALGRAEPARHHADLCLALCEENGIGDFDLAFAHEAVARAAAVAGDGDAVTRHLDAARRASAGIAEADDRDYFLAELDTIPGTD
jgi:hypothetical protein